MEDFLKFIPFILYGLYKLYSSKESKPTPKSNPKRVKRNAPVPSTPSLEEILKKLTGEAPTPNTPVDVPREKVKANKKIEIVDHQYDFRPEYEHRAETGPSLDKIRKNLEVSVPDEVDNEDVVFDVRQAIIAQTILNRPQY
jgi:hypothetical protein